MQRPNPAIALALLALTMSLAGCLGAEDSEGATNDADQPTPSNDGDRDQATAEPGSSPARTGAEAGNATKNATAPPPVTMVGCSEHLGLFPMPESMVADRLPDGFTPEPFQDVPGTVGFFVVALGCDNGSYGEQGLVDPGLIAGGFTVIPPQELASQADVHGMLVGGMVEQPVLAGLLQGWGFPTTEGSFSQNTVGLPTGGSHGTAEGTEGDFTVRMVSNAAPGMEDSAGYTARIFAVANQQASGYMDVQTAGAQSAWTGEATLSLPEVPPAYQGVAIHRIGDGYTYTLAYTPLTGQESSSSMASMNPSHIWSTLR